MATVQSNSGEAENPHSSPAKDAAGGARSLDLRCLEEAEALET